MSTTTNTSDIERVARHHAEAALCHLAHVAGITFDDERFDSALVDLADDIATNLELVEVAQRSMGASRVVRDRVAALEATVSEFGRVDRATVSPLVSEGDDRYRVSVDLYQIGYASSTSHWTFESRDEAKVFRVAALEIVERAT